MEDIKHITNFLKKTWLSRFLLLTLILSAWLCISIYNRWQLRHLKQHRQHLMTSGNLAYAPFCNRISCNAQKQRLVNIVISKDLRFSPLFSSSQKKLRLLK